MGIHYERQELLTCLIGKAGDLFNKGYDIARQGNVYVTGKLSIIRTK